MPHATQTPGRRGKAVAGCRETLRRGFRFGQEDWGQENEGKNLPLHEPLRPSRLCGAQSVAFCTAETGRTQRRWFKVSMRGSRAAAATHEPEFKQEDSRQENGVGNLPAQNVPALVSSGFAPHRVQRCGHPAAQCAPLSLRCPPPGKRGLHPVKRCAHPAFGCPRPGVFAPHLWARGAHLFKRCAAFPVSPPPFPAKVPAQPFSLAPFLLVAKDSRHFAARGTRSPSPRPSPAGRGRNAFRFGLAGTPKHFERWLTFPLSKRERAGVRENGSDCFQRFNPWRDDINHLPPSPQTPDPTPDLPSPNP